MCFLDADILRTQIKCSVPFENFDLKKPFHMEKMSEEKAPTIKRGTSKHYSVNPGAFSNLVIWITACADHPVVWAGDPSVKDHLYCALACFLYHFNIWSTVKLLE